MNEELDKFEEVALRIFTALLSNKAYYEESHRDLIVASAEMAGDFIKALKKPEE